MTLRPGKREQTGHTTGERSCVSQGGGRIEPGRVLTAQTLARQPRGLAGSRALCQAPYVSSYLTLRQHRGHLLAHEAQRGHLQGHTAVKVIQLGSVGCVRCLSPAC